MGRKRNKTSKVKLPRMQFKHGAYYYTPFVDGKVKWIKLSRQFSEALALWLEHENVAPVEHTTVAGMVDTYLSDVLPDFAPKTQEECMRAALKLRDVFGHMALTAVRPKDIAGYLDKRMAKPRRLKDGTLTPPRRAKVAANREIALFSAMYSMAIRKGWCDVNPCAAVDRNVESKRDRYITNKELEALRAAASDQLRAIIDVAYFTAMRKGDILRIRLSDIDDGLLYVRQGKTGKRQGMKLGPKAAAATERAKRLRRRVGTVFLFATQDGTPYSVSGFNSIWRRCVQRAGVPDCHFHDLRAKALTDAKRERGIDYAQALGGHASATMTEGYIKGRETEYVDTLG